VAGSAAALFLVLISLANISALRSPPVSTFRSGSVLYLNTGTARLGADLSCGGAIAYLEKGPASYVNRFDCGREIQLGLYDGSERYDNCSGCTGVFGWNPVQGGDRYRHGSTVMSEALSVDSLYVKTRAYQWLPEPYGGGVTNPVPSDVVAEQWISAPPEWPGSFKVRYRIAYSGSSYRAFASQELPIAYANAQYRTAVFYGGATPWTEAPVTSTALPEIESLQGAAPNFPTTERWMALGTVLRCMCRGPNPTQTGSLLVIPVLPVLRETRQTALSSRCGEASFLENALKANIIYS
jgi:hypothetical protein